MRLIVYAFVIAASFLASHHAYADDSAIHEVVLSECYAFPTNDTAASLQYVLPVENSDWDVYGNGRDYYYLDYVYQKREHVLLLVAHDSSATERIEIDRVKNAQKSFSARRVYNPLATVINRDASWETIEADRDAFIYSWRNAVCPSN